MAKATKVTEKPSPDSSDDFGPRLRAQRLLRGLSLRELARQVGVSPSLVSQIENGKAQPSVSNLYAIVNYLGLSMDQVFTASGERTPSSDPELAQALSPVDSENFVMASSSSRVSLQLEGGVRWDRLTPQTVPGTEFLLITYDVGAASSPEGMFQRHQGREWGYVIRGTLRISVGFEDYVLEAGNAMSFDSAMPHRLANDGDEPVHAVWFVLGRDSGVELH